MRRAVLLALLLVSAGSLTAAGPDSVKPPSSSPSAICHADVEAPKKPQLLPGYGSGGFPVRSSVAEAQAFFDNGMQLAHAFAHKAAIAAFTESVRLDPGCALCLWGEAWASGPTINYPIDADDTERLAGLAARATKLAEGGPEKERLLTVALVARYAQGGGEAGNRAFAEAIDALARRWPDDDELAVLAADAWMTLDSLRGRFENTPRELVLLETVLARNPDYTPAIHFYIHATEIGGEPERAERYADRLPALAPAASHLIHMPSHTFYHIGRYQDAVDANVRAVAIGRENARRLGLPEPDGVWDLPYHGHNVQYGVGAALISGDAKDALALSDPIVARVAAGKAKDESAFPQMVAGTAYFAEARFADPKSVLTLAEPPAKYPWARAYWHYARGEAAARLGDAAAVRREAAAMAGPPGIGKGASDSDEAVVLQAAGRMARIGRFVLQGRAAMLEADPKAALAAFRKAAKLQETESFQQFADPPAFWYPVRRDVAAVLMALGRPKEAVAEAEATLRMMPKEPETERILARARVAARAQPGASFAAR